MHKPPRHFLLPPLLGVAFLAGAAIDMAERPRAADAAPYHKLVHDAAYASGAIPEILGAWKWDQNNVVRDDSAAKELLKPNVLIQRQYHNYETMLEMSFLLDQCPDAETMQGHYPPVCYPNLGQEMKGPPKPVKLRMKCGDGSDLSIPAIQYIFEDRTRDSRSLIFNFFVLPNGHFADDMWEVDEAAKDYTRRYYGAAQLQFVFPLPRATTNEELAEIRAEDKATVESFLSAISQLLMLISKGGRP